MKKIMISALAGGALVLSSVSCSNENITPVQSDTKVAMEFTAGLTATRTSIAPDNSVLWSDGDAISVFDGTVDSDGKDNHKFTITSGAGSSSATFTGEANPGDTYYALYPYSDGAKLADKTISAELPHTQTGGNNTFATGINPSVAVSGSDNNFQFKNIAGLVRVTLPEGYDGEKAVKEIQLSADQSLAGPYTVSVSGDSYSAVAAASETLVGVRLVPGSGSDSITGEEYYLVVLPGSYTNLKMSVIFSDDSYMTGTIAYATIMAGTVFNAPVDPDKAQGPAPDSHLASYLAGETITVNGIEISKERFPKYYHVTSSMTLSKGNTTNGTGVYFVEDGATLNIKTTWQYGFSYLIVIGNSGDRGAKLNIIRDGDMIYAQSNNGNGYYIFSNLTIDNTQGDAIYLNSKEGDNIVYSIGYDDCMVRLGSKSLVTLWKAYQQRFDPFFVKGCTVMLTADNGQLIGSNEQYLNLGNFEIANNIFYSESNSTVKLLGAPKGDADKFVMTYNTFVNAVAPDNDGYIVVNKLNQHYTSTNNIFYHGAEMTGNKIVFFPANYEELDGSLEGSVKRNIGYRESGTDYNWGDVWYGRKPVADFEGITNLVGAENTPFETFDTSNLIFIPKAEYSDCGAQR